MNVLIASTQLVLILPLPLIKSKIFGPNWEIKRKLNSLKLIMPIQKLPELGSDQYELSLVARNFPASDWLLGFCKRHYDWFYLRQFSGYLVKIKLICRLTKRGDQVSNTPLYLGWGSTNSSDSTSLWSQGCSPGRGTWRFC